MDQNDNTKNVLIACTGSVATIKLAEMVQLFLSSSKPVLRIKIIATERAKHFFDGAEIPDNVPVLTDADEWMAWQGRGDPVLHIDLTKWADVMVIAPMDANTLAKTANGLCDNLLMCTLRAWTRTKPLLFCPAMNTKMWEHPVTADHIDKLKTWGYIEVPCVSKTLMCGDTGFGAMAHPRDIVVATIKHLNNFEAYSEF